MYRKVLHKIDIVVEGLPIMAESVYYSQSVEGEDSAVGLWLDLVADFYVDDGVFQEVVACGVNRG